MHKKFSYDPLDQNKPGQGQMSPDTRKRDARGIEFKRLPRNDICWRGFELTNSQLHVMLHEIFESYKILLPVVRPMPDGWTYE